MMPTCKSKYSRDIPIREIDPDQSFYSLVMNLNHDNMNLNYANFFGRKRTFAELRDETDLLAAALVNAGVKSGDVVGVCMFSMPEVASIFLAVNKIGATSFWFDARTRYEDLQHYVTDCKIRHAIIVEPVLPTYQKISGLQKIVMHPMNALGVEPESFSGSTADLMRYRDFLNSGRGNPIPGVDYDSKRAAVIVQSSGSTGKSKAIIHTAFNVNTQMVRLSYMDVPYYAGKRSMICVPPWIIYGLVNSMYSGLAFGMEVVYPLEYKDEIVYNALGSFDICFGVPVFYRYIYDKIQSLCATDTAASRAELKSITEKTSRIDALISGGDKLAENEHIVWQLAFDTPIVNGYGNNEIVGAAIVNPLFANRPGTVGVPMYGVSVKAFDPETMKILQDGESGEIILSSDAMFTSYWNNPDETKRIKQFHDGRWWVHTGDLGYINADGYIVLTGRSKRVIINKLGCKISPDTSENLIMKFPHVRECVVVGVDIEPNNKVPMAFVSLDCPDETGVVIRAIEQACEVLKDYERPKLFATLDEIPHTDNGGKRNILLLEKMNQDYVELRRQRNEPLPVSNAEVGV